MDIKAVVKSKHKYREWRTDIYYDAYFICKLCRFKNGRMWWKTLNFFRPEKTIPRDVTIYLVEGTNTNAFSTFFSFKEEHLQEISIPTGFM